MLLRKFIVYSLSFIVLILFNAYPAFAQSNSSSSALPSTVAPTSPLYTDLLVHNLFHSFSCLAIGQSIIGQPCLTYQMTQNAQGMIQGVPVLSQVNLSGGTLGATTSLIGALYQNPPVRTADYLASLSGSFGVVREANAQVVGSGAQVLSPILKLWQVSRNISYVLMIIIFLVIGLMVMFRNKINPQTVISAQAALPGLVIGLIMITFSYFFAGLISDMAFVGTNIVGYYFSAVRGTPGDQNLVEDMSKQNVLNIFSPFTGLIDNGTATNMLNSIWGSLSDNATYLLTLLAMFMTAQTVTQGTEILKAIPKIGEAIQAIIIAGATGVTWKNPQLMAGFALALIATAILLFAMFKLLLRLINAYLTIVILTLIAPFQFLVAALPGRQGTATNWILSMLANVLIFPAVIAVFYFVAFLVDPSFVNNNLNKNCGKTNEPPCIFRISQSNQTNSDFTPVAYAQEGIQIAGIRTFPLFGGINLDFLRIFLAFGALVALPTIPDLITRTIGKMGPAGDILGQGIGGAVGAGRQYAGQFQQGVGAASGQLARARGLFNTPGYERYYTGKEDSKGKQIWGVREVYSPGTGYSFGALARNKRIGGLISRVTGRRVGGVPPQEKTPTEGKTEGEKDNSTPA